VFQNALWVRALGLDRYIPNAGRSRQMELMSRLDCIWRELTVCMNKMANVWESSCQRKAVATSPNSESALAACEVIRQYSKYRTFTPGPARWQSQ
jgi:hypothetical protein